MVIFRMKKCQQQQLPGKCFQEIKSHVTSKNISKITISLHLKILRIDIHWTGHQLIQKLVSSISSVTEPPQQHLMTYTSK